MHKRNSVSIDYYLTLCINLGPRIRLSPCDSKQESIRFFYVINVSINVKMRM
jgi:hypothetical protein